MKYKITILFSLLLTNCTYTEIMKFPKVNYLGVVPSNSSQRYSSYPYISGDTFRSFCDFVIDKTNTSIDPDTIKNGDTIFIACHTILLDFFFENVHPKIKSSYILVTHNSDKSDFDSYAKYLDNENITAWFGQNMTLVHQKTFPIPIGFPNKYWKYKNTDIIDNAISNLPQKDILLYMNFAIGTNKKKRQPVFDMFSKKAFCYKPKRKPLKDFVNDMARSKFILSPEGNGVDCVRTWEALYLGSIPIVSSSTLDRLFKNLPVIIVDDWNKITEEFLIKKYNEISFENYNMEKIFADYWFKKISEFKEKAKTK